MNDKNEIRQQKCSNNSINCTDLNKNHESTSSSQSNSNEHHAFFIKLKDLHEQHPSFSAQPIFVQMGLIYQQKYASVHAQSFQLRVFASDLLKLQGNQQFKAQNHSSACEYYEQALAIFRYISIVRCSTCSSITINNNNNNNNNNNTNLNLEGIQPSNSIQTSSSRASATLNITQSEVIQNQLPVQCEHLSVDSLIKGNFQEEDLKFIDDNGKNDREKKLVKASKVILYQNICLTYLKMAQQHLLLLTGQQNAISEKQKKTQLEYSSKLIADAIMACSEAIKLDFKGSKAYYLRAKARQLKPIQAKDDFKLALKDFKKALDLDPTNANIITEMAKAQLFLEKSCEPLLPATISTPVTSSLKSNHSPQCATQAYIISEQEQQLQQQQQQQQQQQHSQQQHQQNISNENKPKVQVSAVVTSANINGKSTPSLKISLEFENQSEDNSANSKVQTSLKNNISSKINRENSEHWYHKTLAFWSSVQLEFASPEFTQSHLPGEASTVEVPREIKDLEEFVEGRSHEVLQLYEIAGRVREAEELRKQLEKARQTKIQLEKIARVDFAKPNAKLVAIAEQHDIDLNDELIQHQFKNFQDQNLLDIRNWLAKLGFKHYGRTE